MIEVELRHRQGDFTLDVAFSAPLPGVVALFGPSGSGKTTVIELVAGLRRPEAGRIVVDGTVFLDTAKGIEVAPERRRLGYVFQDARLFPHMDVAANLRYGLARAPKGDHRIGFDRVVELLGIAHLVGRRPHTLSGGERQRVAIGRALLAQPRLLLMDEPLANLDAARRAEVLPYLERLRDELNLPILHVSHDWGEVASLADTLVLMERGRVVAAGALPDLASRTDLPLIAGRFDAGSVVPATIARHDAGRGLTHLAFEGGELVAAQIDRPAGTRLRLRIAARDVILATRPPEGISVHNILAGRIASIAPENPTHVLVGVAIGPTVILARVTRDAIERLSLAPGSAVHVLFKSVSLDRPRPGASLAADPG